MRKAPMERARSRSGPQKRPASTALRAEHAIELALSVAALVIGLTATTAVHAIGLDEIAQQSGLGEPLRLVIPVLSSAEDQLASEEFAGECFKLVAPAGRDLPSLNSARIGLEHRGGRAFVVLSTSYPMNEPIMRVAVQAGCRVSVSREYTVLLDPVPIQPPIVEKATEMPAAVAAAAAMAAEPAVAPAAAVPLVAAESPRVPSAAGSRKQAGTIRSKSEAAVQRTNRAAPASPAVRSAKPSQQPRLQVSRTIAATTSAPVSSAAPSSAAEQEALRAIEEQTVVLQRQIAELSLAMERMQQELAAARAARAEAENKARVATEHTAAATSPWAAMRAWAGLNWPLLVLIPALVVLVAAALHRRRPVLVPKPITPAQAAAFNPADLGEPSVPAPEPLREHEAVVASIARKPRAHVIPPPFVEPAQAAAESKHDPELAFDYDVQQSAQQSSVYSALEREQPGIVGRLTDSWGTPKAAAQLENYLLTPRRAGRELSVGAIEELKLLRSIALDRIGGLTGDMVVPRARGGNGHLRVGGS